jgi:hypothetical protein
MIDFLVAVTIIGAGYAALILLLESLAGRWGFVLAPGVFLALSLAVVRYFESSKALSEDHIPLAISLLVWALLPPLVTYRVSRRAPRPPRLVQLGYGLGAFLVATAALFSIFAKMQLRSL